MCRLFAWHADRKVTLADALGPDTAALETLSHDHKDGWGIAIVDDGGHLQVDKLPEAAWASEGYLAARDSLAAQTAIAHIRWGSPGMPPSAANTHPFMKDSPIGWMAFAHNGMFLPDSLPGQFADADLIADLDGVTDSEQYFALLISRLRRADGDLVAAVRATAADIAPLRFHSANALVLTSTHLAVICLHRPDMRGELEPDYFDLHYREHDGVITAWSQWMHPSAPESPELPNGSMLLVDRATGAFAVHEIAS